MAIALTLQLVGAQPAVSQSGELMAYSVSRDPGLDPGASTWRTAPTVEVALSAQQSTWPFGGGSIRGLEAQAVHTDDMLYIRMSWADDTSNSDALAVDQFVDAAAIEFPAQAASSVPALCMGQSDSGVNIWHWQAGADGGRPESIEELSSNGYVDRYPSTDDLYFPAREAGNPVATRPPIQNLVALGFGTLEPADDQLVQGGAEWASGRWSVVFARELSHESAEQVDLGGEVTTDVVFAVWDGEADERNGMKSVSPFVVLYVSPDGTPRNVGAQLAILIGGAVGLGGFVLREVTTHRARQASSVPSSS
ncbi:MAG: hypothetical protein GY724_21280 [Actinomycetia bacterium]|nr:hypothetical protein [Actinomycetes bacterium]MCP4224328.1 hypothetical protein [Actinomycetes bacterium]